MVSISDVWHGGEALGIIEEHGHGEYSIPRLYRESPAFVRQAVETIEVSCCDALPMSRITREYSSIVWKHFE